MNRTQEVELTNMCFIYDENRILVVFEKRIPSIDLSQIFPLILSYPK